MMRLALMVCLLPSSTLAVEVLGPTYPISEPHLLQLIEQRLRAKAASGELQQLQAKAAERVRRDIQQPAAVPGLSTTQRPRTFYTDPSFTLDRNLLSAQGELLYLAGSRHNPLAVVSLSQPLLFFDGRDARQVRQAQTLLAQHNGQLKPILVGGAYLELIKRWNRPVYFDQHGRLTRRLGIQQVPALVTQADQLLRIDELPVLP